MAVSFWDLIVVPYIVAVILIVSSIIKKRNEELNPAYRYYVWGIVAKIFGAVSLCLIYTFYYNGGDTVNYFLTARTFCNMLFKNPSVFFDVVVAGNLTPENFSQFDESTGYPMYWWDKHTIFVARVIVPLVLVTFKSFIGSAILLGWICYSGLWRLYILFTDRFPAIRRNLAISILFIPSVVFWGSGLLKDTITLSAVGWFAFSFHKFFILKNVKFSHGAALLISSFLLVTIKPYIFFALLPGSIIWLSNEQTARISNKILKVLVAPLLLVSAVSLGVYALSQMGDYLGIYSIDNVFSRAVLVQQDLKKDYYGGNTFDIGDFDASLGSMLGKSHLAISAALFRPTLLDVKNIVMLLSALENTYIMLLTLFLLFRLKFIGFFGIVWKDPLLLFSVLFALFFAFAVGLSTPNFGSLVRLKIPCIPLFVSSLFVIRHLFEKKYQVKLKF